MHSSRFRAGTGWLVVLAALLFLTQPGGRARGAEPVFRFAAIADTHIADPMDMVRFRRFLYSLRQTHRPDFLLILGDLCGHAPEYLPQMKEVMDRCGLKVYPLPGNHDDNYARNASWYRDVFGVMHYSFDHKGYHFVMNWSQSQPTEWVRKDLAAVGRAAPVIFCQHYPPPKQGAEGAEPWATLGKHPNVKQVLAGHWHRHFEGRVGEVPFLVLRNCNFNRHVRNPGSYYLMQAFPGGRIEFQQIPLKRLKLLAPPDAVPTVAVASPAVGNVLRGAARFRGTASDDQAVRKVEYSIDFSPWRPAEGAAKWHFAIDTTGLRDGHHLFRVRSIDSAGQASLDIPLRLAMVANAPLRPGVFRFQQGVGGYAGCTDVTVRRHGDRKSPTGAGGNVSDLENWIWKAGEVEYAEFYIRFDLSRCGIARRAKVKRAALVLHGSRMNGVKSDEEDRCRYAVGVMTGPWEAKMAFPARPPRPGWRGGRKLTPKPDLVGKWPYLGGRQIVMPPKVVVVDLTPLARHVEGWLKDPASNHGLVFSPFGANYNFSAKSSRSPIATLRPMLEIEMDQR